MSGSACGQEKSLRPARVGGLPRALGLRLARLLRRVLWWPGNVYRAQQILHRMSELTECELRDIGLTPGDLNAVRGLPLDADPSAALARRVEERRGRCRAVSDAGESRHGPKRSRHAGP